MSKEAPKTDGKKSGGKTFVQKILGENPLASAAIILAIVTVCLLMSFSKETIERYEEAIIRKGQELFGIKEKNPCAEGWTFYEHDAIGLSFCYPSEWGEVTMSTEGPVTRLEGLLDGAYDRSSFSIGFDKKESVSLRLFNEEYGGERYPNSYAEKYGFVDNINKLKEGGDICSYKMDFNHTWEYEGRINETYAACEDGVKTTIVDKQEYFDKEVHSDVLESFAYARLQNGYFDHALLAYTYGGTTQLERKFDSPDAFLSQVNKTREDFEKEKSVFTAFAESLKAFAPEKKAQPAFETTAGEDARVTAIRKYYYLLEGAQFEEAFAMQAEDGRDSYEEFFNRYKNLYVAVPYDFKNTGGDDLYFLVKYQDHNKAETKYGVKMTVAQGKLRQTFMEEFKGETSAFGDDTAFAVERGGRNYLILKKGETETIVDEGAAKYDENFSNISEVKEFPEFVFSQNGSYLLYSASGYEWVMSYVYDIKDAKSLGNFIGVSVEDGFGLTPDEKYLYVCRSGGMDSALPGEVYSLPNMTKVFDAASGSGAYNDSACRYDAAQKAIIFTLSSPFPEDAEPKNKEVKYEVAG